jgi:dienelactone hydrolase
VLAARDVADDAGGMGGAVARSSPLLFLVVLGACGAEPLRPPPEVIHARFDPTAKVVPMPSDLLRDEQAGRLALPQDDPALAPAVRELYAHLNTLEAWPATSTARVELTGPAAASSLTAETVQVYQHAKGEVRRVEGATLALSSDGKRIEVAPPEGGWERGAVIAVVVRGGPGGLRGARGEPVECDAAFYFLRLRQPLNLHPDFRAFPGATLAEREKAARDLDAIRVKLAPYFADLEEKRGIPRAEVAALWTFSVNDDTEVLMDKASGKMPLPIDLLRDELSGRVELPARAGDSAKEKQIKEDLRAYDGFATTASQLFELSAPVDPSTLNETTVQLYPVVAEGAFAPIPVTVSVAPDLRRVEVAPKQLPLAEKTTYAVVLRPGIRDARGKPVRPMLTGVFLGLKSALVVDGASVIESLDLASAKKLEASRARLAPLLDRLGRDQILAAWPFTTLTIVDPLLSALGAAERLKLPPDPKEIVESSAAKALLDFPLASLTTLLNVKKVFQGKLATADFLDPLTRARFKDGSFKERWISFMLTIPEVAVPGASLPVVIFGHAICTERRFVLAVADALAQRGFAAIAIDLPYHGERTACAWNGPICFPDPLSKEGAMLCPDPCPGGASCGADGLCRDKSGAVVPFSTWPVIKMPQASGAAFIELDSIAGTTHHFSQAVTDLGALSRSLAKGDWQKAVGYGFKTERIGYLGQSLGGIIGATYAPLDPRVGRAVLNVPGANLVPMFLDSKYFGPHIDAYLKRESIEKGSAEHQRFLQVARWFMDAVDPLNVARYLVKEPLPGAATVGREALVQMAKLDFIIPNASTIALAELAGVPRRDYLAEHAFLAIPVEPAYKPGNDDAAEFLAGSLKP